MGKSVSIADGLEHDLGIGVAPDERHPGEHVGLGSDESSVARQVASFEHHHARAVEMREVRVVVVPHTHEQLGTFHADLAIPPQKGASPRSDGRKKGPIQGL